MPKSKFDFLDSSHRRRRPVVSRDDEVDAETCRVQEAIHPADPKTGVPQLTNAELVQLQIRVIALEHLVMVLLSEASDRQRAMVLELATAISPRPGFTPHRLTISRGGPDDSSFRTSLSFWNRISKMSLRAKQLGTPHD